MENELQYQRNRFIDFEKAFDVIWYEGLWHLIQKLKIGETLVQVTEMLKKKLN